MVHLNIWASVVITATDTNYPKTTGQKKSDVYFHLDANDFFMLFPCFFKSALNFISPDGSNRVYFIAICLVSLGHVEIERWKRRSTIVSNINGRIYHVSIKRRVVPLCTKIGNPPNSLITIWGHNRIVLHKIFLNSI